MTTLSLTDPVNGTTVDASLHATNNAAIKTVVNGNIDNNNIKSSAGIAISKLASYPSDSSKALLGDGTWGRQIIKSTTAVDVVSSVTETDLLNSLCVLPALASDSIVQLRATGFLKNSTGSSANITYKIVLGTTTIYQANSLVASATNARNWLLNLTLMNAGATNSQVCHAFMPHANDTAPTTGFGNVVSNVVTTSWNSGLNVPAELFGGTAAEDTTSSKTLKFTVTLGSSSASLECKCYGFMAEVM